MEIPVLRPWHVEPVTTEEQHLATLVDMVENDLTLHNFQPRIPERRDGDCVTASDVVSAFAEMDGRRANVYEVRDVHSRLSGEDMDHRAFAHWMAVVWIGRTAFLTDLTFVQFMMRNGEIGQRHGLQTGMSTTHPLAQAFVHNGYAKLTDETLRDYLLLTSAPDPQRRDYIAGVAGASLDRITPWKVFYDTEKYRSGEAYHRIPQRDCAYWGCDSQRTLPGANQTSRL